MLTLEDAWKQIAPTFPNDPQVQKDIRWAFYMGAGLAWRTVLEASQAPATDKKSIIDRLAAEIDSVVP